MNIESVSAVEVRVPYKVPFRPAHEPGRVRTDRVHTIAMIRTEDGTVGYASADGLHAAAVEHNIAPYLVGASIWDTATHARIFRNGGRLWFLDIAVWDIIGKLANTPVYRLWGATRERVKAYASAPSWWTPDEIVEVMHRYREDGVRAVKIRIHEETMREDLAVVDAAIDAAREVTLMVDVNQANRSPAPLAHPVWDYQRALKTCRELEQRNVYWIEEPLPLGFWHEYRRLTAETEIYVAGGETSEDLFTFRDLIANRVYDIIQPDPVTGEGISQLRKVAAMAEMYNTPCCPHMASSAIGDSANLHLACATSGLVWFELMYEPPSRDIETYQLLGGILQNKIWIDSDGYVGPSNDPGFGIVVDEDALEHYRV
jgi:D-galactarolactone cycloisomerase